MLPSGCLSICSRYWSPCSAPTGMNSLPPGFNWSTNACGTVAAAAPTWIASNGASGMKMTWIIYFYLITLSVLKCSTDHLPSGQPSQPSPNNSLTWPLSSKYLSFFKIFSLDKSTKPWRWSIPMTLPDFPTICAIHAHRYPLPLKVRKTILGCRSPWAVSCGRWWPSCNYQGQKIILNSFHCM